MSFTRHLRRQAQRHKTRSRRGWRRSFSYKEETLPYNGIVVYTPQSRDAPFGEVDDRFWKRFTIVIVLIISAGLALVGLLHL